jgi:hypothetical protein
VEKQLRAGSAAGDVSPTRRDLDRHQRPWPWAGDDAGAHPDEPDHFQPAPLDAGGNPYSDLRHDHRFGGERRADADQRLRVRPLSVSGDLYPADCHQLYRGWARRGLCREKGPALSALDGFSIGMGATCAMFVLGSMREILGNGTLFDGADSLLGSWAKVLRIEVFHTDTPFLLAMLPPGAFIGLGMMLAVKYLIDERSKQRKAKAVQADVVAPSDVTGKAWNE